MEISARAWFETCGFDNAIFFEQPDFDSAIIGATSDGKAVYDYEKMIHHFATAEGIGHDDAREFIDFNTIRALPYVGDYAPVVVFPYKERPEV